MHGPESMSPSSPEPDEEPRLGDIPTRDLLVGLGGILALLLGPLVFLLGIPFGFFGFGAAVAALVSVVFGFLLVVSVNVMRRNLLNGLILAGLSSLILLGLGGIAGVVGGLFGLVGSLYAFVRGYTNLLD